MEIQLSENIKRLRKAHALTQEQFAEAMGVTVGAVHKWEIGRSMPEIPLLIEIADFFDTSVDALLGYTWQNDNVKNVVDHLCDYTVSKNFTEGLRYAERALKKYPNNFEVVYRLAELYFLASTLDREKAWRAIELYRDAVRLVAQNERRHISAETLENRIALCYSRLEKNDEAIEILKKNNAERQNEFRIGSILSRIDGRADEALSHLSDALVLCWGHLYDICGGYANAYMQKAAYEKLKRLMLWFYQTGQGLRDTDKVSFFDRGDIGIFAVLALVALTENDADAAKAYLRRAKALAERFDAAPNYVFSEVYFYHGAETGAVYDDMGDTAMDIILNFIHKEPSNRKLLPIWEEICNESK